MAYTIWAVARSALTITGASGGSGLSGLTQGDGSHLVGATIVWNGGGWQEIAVSDSDPNFDDNDTGQTVRQTIWGVTYNNRVIEAEYRIVLRAPDGTTYTAVGVNVNEPGGGSGFGTVEGLAFIGQAPPPGVTLSVVSAREGPGSSGQPATQAPVYYVPPCFTPGVLIRTETGARPVESLAPGDMVWTLDGGPRPLRRLLSRRIGPAELAARPGAEARGDPGGGFGAGATCARPCRLAAAPGAGHGLAERADRGDGGGAGACAGAGGRRAGGGGLGGAGRHLPSPRLRPARDRRERGDAKRKLPAGAAHARGARARGARGDPRVARPGAAGRAGGGGGAARAAAAGRHPHQLRALAGRPPSRVWRNPQAHRVPGMVVRALRRTAVRAVPEVPSAGGSCAPGDVVSFPRENLHDVRSGGQASVCVS